MDITRGPKAGGCGFTRAEMSFADKLDEVEYPSLVDATISSPLSDTTSFCKGSEPSTSMEEDEDSLQNRHGRCLKCSS